MNTDRLFGTIALVIMCLIPSFAFSGGTADAQNSKTNPRAFEPHTLVGLGFDFPSELSTDGRLANQNLLGNADIAMTRGLFVEFDYPANKYFTFGARMGVKQWKFDADNADRNTLINLNAVPKLRYPFLPLRRRFTWGFRAA